jgi:hypothetical protein
MELTTEILMYQMPKEYAHLAVESEAEDRQRYIRVSGARHPCLPRILSLIFEYLRAVSSSLHTRWVQEAAGTPSCLLIRH